MNSIPIYLVVGFLGSGKTTLLKRLVNSSHGRDFVYVINEFSAVDVDAGQIEREGGAAIAVAGGSIFCRCLISEFVSVMRRLSEGIPVNGNLVKPAGVVVEASGMADPRSIKKLLAESHLNDLFHVAGVTAIVDPGVLMKLLLVLPNIKGQIQTADLILFNKIDLHNPETVDKVTRKVRAINPHAQVMHCTQCNVDTNLILKDGESESVKLEDADYSKCRDPHYANETIRFSSEVELKALLACLPDNAEGLYRAKGYVKTTDGWLYVDWSEGGLTYKPSQPQSDSALTVIWSPETDSPLIGNLRYLAH